MKSTKKGMAEFDLTVEDGDVLLSPDGHAFRVQQCGPYVVTNGASRQVRYQVVLDPVELESVDVD